MYDTPPKKDTSQSPQNMLPDPIQYIKFQPQKLKKKKKKEQVQ